MRLLLTTKPHRIRIVGAPRVTTVTLHLPVPPEEVGLAVALAMAERRRARV